MIKKSLRFISVSALLTGIAAATIGCNNGPNFTIGDYQATAINIPGVNADRFADLVSYPVNAGRGQDDYYALAESETGKVGSNQIV